MKKKITTGKKLSLDKETIANLSEEQQSNLQGGAITDIKVSEDSCVCMSKNGAEAKEEEIVTAAARSCCKGSC